LYKLQKYQTKLESGTGDKSFYNAKVQFYQDLLVGGKRTSAQKAHTRELINECIKGRKKAITDLKIDLIATIFGITKKNPNIPTDGKIKNSIKILRTKLRKVPTCTPREILGNETHIGMEPNPMYAQVNQNSLYASDDKTHYDGELTTNPAEPDYESVVYNTLEKIPERNVTFESYGTRTDPNYEKVSDTDEEGYSVMHHGKPKSSGIYEEMEGMRPVHEEYSLMHPNKKHLYETVSDTEEHPYEELGKVYQPPPLPRKLTPPPT
jgi:hypothetical protein